MLNSINTNIAAYSAQGNIGKASNSAAASIGRLSSGSRIQKASDDVAALSIGTSLKTGVTTLKQALANTSQGTSLLQVADGALSQISDILQRQKAIATQANSGTLSDTERGYLNQEFQALKSQIDQISSSTAFSSVKLLDGSLAGAAEIKTNVNAAKLPLSAAPVALITVADELTNNDVLTFNGVAITIATVPSGQSQVAIGSDGPNQASLLATALNAHTDPKLTNFYFTANATTGALSVQVRNGRELATRDDALFTYATTTIGTAGDITGAIASTNFATGDSATLLTLGTAAPANGDQITIGGVTVDFTTATAGTATAVGKVQIGTNGTAATAITDTLKNLATFLNQSTDARLSNFYFESTATTLTARLATGALGGTAGLSIASTVVIDTGAAVYTAATAAVADTNSVNGLGEDRTKAIGTVTGSLLANGGAATTVAGPAINLSGLRNNAAFVGKLGQGDLGSFTASYTATDSVTLSLKVGDITYTSGSNDLSNAAITSVTLTGTDANGNKVGGSFVLNFAGGGLTDNSVLGQTDANDLAKRLNNSFDSVTFVQSRDVASFSTGATVSVSGVEIARLDGASVDLRTDSATSGKISSFTITAPTNGQTDAIFEAVIDGETYRSISNIGSTFDNNKSIQLQSTTNANNVLTIVTGNNDTATSSTISIDVGTQAKADAVAAAFSAAFGLDDVGSTLSFQIGSTSNDTIGVKIDSVNTDTLYGGADLDVTTIIGAQAASVALDTAINSINNVRASVGALQSRLDYTAANLQSSIQNQDAARGTLLDTDVAAESTAYATAQVQLQAGIAVLAQANQLPQNLLKLIS